jgi:hypothetical protein
LWLKRYFHQTFHYLPGDKAGRGRWIPTDEGIGGWVYEEKANFEESYPNAAAYRTDMLTNYRYSQESLGQRASDRLSFNSGD